MAREFVNICDNCKVETRDSITGWVTVDIGNPRTVDEDDIMAGDFCSIDCAIDWLRQRRDEVGNGHEEHIGRGMA